MNAPAALIVCVIAIASAALFGVFTRRFHRARLARAQGRFEKQRHTLTTQLDQARRQIGLLQDELTAARREIDRLAHAPASPVVPPASPAALAAAKQELTRLLVDPPPRRAPANGFADTLPSLFAEDAGLLIR